MVLGHDAAGVVEEVGSSVGRLRVGDEVWAYRRIGNLLILQLAAQRSAAPLSSYSCASLIRPGKGGALLICYLLSAICYSGSVTADS
ncbi:MAG: alcohol dehydrogenase catalytic domain-containing protein [Verrucomicrobia bacterium]|nr:alcohol dehydrogenase catalytic domain-containing protein [Verrucomicrobiota bacterium]